VGKGYFPLYTKLHLNGVDVGDEVVEEIVRGVERYGSSSSSSSSSGGGGCSSGGWDCRLLEKLILSDGWGSELCLSV